MKFVSLWFAALASLPLIACEDVEIIGDILSALLAQGIDASNFDQGAPHAELVGDSFGSIADVVARGSGVSGCKYSCGTLALLSSDGVVYPGSAGYNLIESTYWSQIQAEIEPYCIYQPKNAAGVSVAILLSRLTQCPFAVKSGGHAAFAGASNIEGGITINLAKLNEIQLSKDKSVTAIGAGNTWFDVYSELEPYNLTVIGGRVAAIGVGGLTLGGGISFFSGNHGWACDNVANYEIVTASGLVVNANTKSNSDLYYALRGGGNNFGVVTRFDLYTYPQGLMLGGTLTYTIDNSDAILRALVAFSKNAPSDPNAALIVAYAYAEQLGGFLAVADLEYALPELRPAIFEDFQAIPYVLDTTAIRTLPNITILFNDTNPGGLRETYWTATYKVDLDLLQYMVREYQAQALPLLTGASPVANLQPSYVLQIITTDQLAYMGKYGGNALGLTEAEGPLLLLNIAWWWSDAADDERVLKAAKAIVDNTVAYSKSKGLGNDYLYMNYASQFQSVISSYNTTNYAKLKAIAKKYDPSGVFQTLSPGYFKLSGATAELS